MLHFDTDMDSSAKASISSTNEIKLLCRLSLVCAHLIEGKVFLIPSGPSVCGRTRPLWFEILVGIFRRKPCDVWSSTYVNSYCILDITRGSERELFVSEWKVIPAMNSLCFHTGVSLNPIIVYCANQQEMDRWFGLLKENIEANGGNAVAPENYTRVKVSSHKRTVTFGPDGKCNGVLY